MAPTILSQYRPCLNTMATVTIQIQWLPLYCHNIDLSSFYFILHWLWLVSWSCGLVQFGTVYCVGENTHNAIYLGRRFFGAGSAYGQSITCLVVFVFLTFFHLQEICRIHATAVVRKSTPTTLGRVQGSVFWGSQVLHLVFGVTGLKEFQFLTPNWAGAGGN